MGILARRPCAVGTCLAVFLLLHAVPLQAEEQDSCVKCHAAFPNELGAPVEGMKQDVHGEHGISCADCHGGDPRAFDMSAMDPQNGYRGVPTKQEIPDRCGSCHSDPAYMRRFDPSIETGQRERFRTSVHGMRLAEGDENVATCVSCHGVHGIRSARQADSPVYPANLPATCGSCHSNAVYMADYEIGTHQQESYRRSVHGELLLQERDLSAPTCATCHGNHGASPPGLTEISQVCGQCHVTNAELFSKSPHKAAFAELGLSECSACHDHHDVRRTSDEQLGVDGAGQCARCHGVGTPGYQAGEQMRATVDRLKRSIESADAVLSMAEAAGMEVSDARYDFQSVNGHLIQTRTAMHRFSPDYMDELAAPGIALAADTQEVASEALRQARARRLQLLFPLGLIALTILLLALKLRSMERT